MTAILIPATIFFIAARALLPVPLAITPFLSGLVLVALGQLFYLTLTVMLGTIFESRGPITGIAIAFIMTGLLLKGFIPLMVMVITPWLLPDVASGLALRLPLPSFWFVPVLATAIWVVLMITVALWRFGREEF
jgi:ABC-2 type transport system permease protein